MTLFSISSVLLSFALAVFATQAQARIAIVPAKAIFSEAKELSSVAYFHPCGAKSLGVVLDRKTNKQVNIGVALSLPDATCTGLPNIRSLDVSAMRFAKDSSFQPYLSNLKKTPLQFSRINNLKFNQAKSELQIVHHRSCHALQASLPVISQSQDGISVGILEYRMHKPGPCRHSQKNLNLPARMSKNISYLNTLQNKEKVEDLSSLPYELKLSPIKNISTARGKGIGVSFDLSCKDAPIGVFVRKVAREHDTKFMVAALTAHFPLKVCDSKKPTRTVLNIPQFHIPASKLIAVRSSKIRKLSSLQVMKPQQIKMIHNAETKTAQAQVQFIKDCDRHLGLVFAQDRLANLSIGVLKKQERFRCSGGITAQTMHQPMIISKSLTNSRVYPLSLEGQAAI